MLKKSIRACAVLASLVVLLGTSLATSYEFGSRVRLGDTDVGDLLLNFSPTVRYWDLGAPGLDTNDVAYLAQGTAVVLPNDVRLTPFAGNPAGTRVRPIDLDAYKPIPLPVPGTWRYSNLYASAVCVIDDPIYWSNAATLSVADLRLSKIQTLNPGTWVQDSNIDFKNPIILLNNALPMFHDVNSNAVYDDSDSVYLKINNASPTEVQPGDLRLTAINGHS
jgi:hypothetical protein